jgi:hypothetical protein
VMHSQLDPSSTGDHRSWCRPESPSSSRSRRIARSAAAATSSPTSRRARVWIRDVARRPPASPPRADRHSSTPSSPPTAARQYRPPAHRAREFNGERHARISASLRHPHRQHGRRGGPCRLPGAPRP